MLRYLKAVQMMKQILEEKNLTVMCTVARYACAYEKIAKPDWWDKSKRYVFRFGLIPHERLLIKPKSGVNQLWPRHRAGHTFL